MDPERIVFCVILTVVLGVSGFILWGPSDKYKRKPGRIGGLVNSGLTCFLNTLLQALASCPSMLEWLSQQTSVSDTLTTALKEALLVLNGQHPTIFDDPYTPSEVIKSLSLKGWVISPGEQDAHELFHVIMTTLTEETSLDHNKVVSLSDALLSASRHNHFIRIGPRKIQSDITHLNINDETLWTETLTNSVASCPAFLPPQIAPPFQGLLTSQLECNTCNYKSAVRYDKFDSLSLHLPNISEKVFLTKLTLCQLLDKFVSTEIVKDVHCEKCNKHRDEINSVKTSAKKTLNFGKLPKCLCFHIQRSTWQRNGQPYKRYDYIQFPEYLSMKEYTYMEVQKRKAHLSEYNNCELNDQSPAIANHASNSMKHIYRLSAVIVHTGSLEGGHFVTYRRSPVKEHNWYYTSDSEVRESSLKEALLSCAYMLFYNEYIPKDGMSIPYPSQAVIRNSNA